MLCDKSLELIRELDRVKDSLPPFNEDVARQVLEEMRALFEQNQRDVNAAVAGEANLINAVQVRHAALERNKRCLLSYLYNRLQRIRDLRWHFGSILPSDIKSSMCVPESHWFGRYSKALANYMKAVSEDHALDLTQYVKPPKHLYLEVRVLQDYGELETEDGDSVVLKLHSIHFLPRSQCEPLIRQGILEHVES